MDSFVSGRSQRTSINLFNDLIDFTSYRQFWCWYLHRWPRGRHLPCIIQKEDHCPLRCIFDQSITRVLSPSRCYCRSPPPPLPPPGSCPPCTRAPSEIVERLFELSLDKRSDLLTNNGSSLVCQTQSWYVVIIAHQSGHLSSGQIRAERSHNLALGQTKPAFEDLRLQQQAEVKRMINC